jgi:peptidoglycan/LPS O-acetylase OafA/YrhL
VNHRYATLDGLRGLAAFAVLLLHVQTKGPPNAYLAVDFFFVLSGFVVAHAYERRLAGGMGLLDFVRTRVLRLYPLAVLGVVLGGLWFASRGVPLDDLLRASVAGALMLPSWDLAEVSAFVFPGDPPLWSLFFELAANFAFALAVPFLTTRRLIAATALFGGVLVWAALVKHGLDVGWRLDDFGYGTARVLFPFTCGILLRRLPPPPPLGQAWLWPVAGVLLAILFCPLPRGPILAVAAGLFLFPAVVTAGAAVRAGPQVGAFLLYLGRLSYPVYVLHNPIIRIVRSTARGLSLDGAWLTPATVLVVLLASHAAMVFYDEPLRAWVGRRLAPKPEPQLAKAA